jgi:lysozyme family protein
MNHFEIRRGFQAQVCRAFAEYLSQNNKTIEVAEAKTEERVRGPIIMASGLIVSAVSTFGFAMASTSLSGAATVTTMAQFVTYGMATTVGPICAALAVVGLAAVGVGTVLLYLALD